VDKPKAYQRIRMERSCNQDSKSKFSLGTKVILIFQIKNSTKGYLEKLATKGILKAT
jgi:hypothetical protein